MTRILHLSDPHFGAHTPAVFEHFMQVLPGLSPDLIVISGDLTQRARPAQFAAARGFIAGLGAPVLAVPGNHDAPLLNIVQRLCDPWRGWRGLGARAVWADDRVVVAGVNTADPRVWKRGRFTPALQGELARAFATAGSRRRIAVLHHPIQHPPEDPQGPLRGAALAAQALAGLGVCMVLSGHLHRPGAAPLTAAPGVLQVLAGSVLSWRLRGAPNGFNLIDLGGSQPVITEWRLGPDGFAPRPLWP